MSACARCAGLGKTCCQRSEVLVTLGDVARISRHTGRDGAWEWRAPADPSYLEQQDDPNFRLWGFSPDGHRRALKRNPNGDCVYLGNEGCTLPNQVRPLVCRLYPHAYTERGLDGIAPGCPSELVPEGTTILRVLDMRWEDAVRWHCLLYSELKEDYEAAHRRNDL